MNKILPQRFDANEWFLIVSLLCVVVFASLLPRRFPGIVTIVFLSIGFGISMCADFFFAPPPNDFYDVNDSKYYELFEIPFYYLYAPFAYLFVYFFDKWRVQGLFVTLYVLIWSAVGTGFEALAVYFHVFRYKTWRLEYSWVFYLAVQSFYLLLYYIIKKKYHVTKREEGRDWP